MLHIASGLLWLSELIEEHSRTAKSLGQRGIYVRVINILKDMNAFSYVRALGDHRPSRPLVFLRLAALTPSPILDRVPHRLSSKLHSSMASSVSDVCHIPRILRYGHRRPLPVVLLLRSRHPRRTAQSTAVLWIAQSNQRSRIRRYRYILWHLRLACAVIPLPYPQCERQRTAAQPQ